jgi:hypothetical protein
LLREGYLVLVDVVGYVAIGLFLGFLFGIMVTIVVHGLFRDSRERRRVRAARAEAFDVGWDGGAEYTADVAFREGAARTDQRWRDWYAKNFPDEGHGVAGSA